MTIFIDNKYTKLYFAIVEHARKFPPETFYEKHHIIPKSLNGANDSQNLVKLSYRQHFICHLLLTKMTEGKHKYQMMHAMFYMRTNTPKQTARSGEEVRRLSSRWFCYCKQLRKKIGIPQDVRDKMSQSMIGKNTGKIASIEARAKMSVAATDRVVSTDTKAKISNRVKQEWSNGIRSHVGKKSYETRKKNGCLPSMSGKTHSEETKLKMSIAAKTAIRPKPTEEALKKRAITVSMLRWITKDGTNKRVNESLVNSFLDNGWSIGKCR